MLENDRSTRTAAELAAELSALEDRIFWDIDATLAVAAEIQQVAAARGEVALVMRARLVEANMLMRQGVQLAAAARTMWDVNRWAAENGCQPVLARSHLLLAATFHNLGDPGACLEHALQAVELLDDQASPHAHVWHRIKLADALTHAGSAEDARERYQQAEKLAVELGLSRLHMAALNNSAYAECVAGEPERAWEVAERLQAVAAAHGYRLDPQDLDTIARIQVENGRFAEAEQTMHACIARHSEGHNEDAGSLANFLLTLAAAQRGLGALDRAQATIDRSRVLCAERNLAAIQVRLLREQAELHAARGDFAAAFAVHKAFFADYEHLHSLQREAQGRTRQAMFETAEAREEAERFREQARRDPLTGLWNRRYVDEHLTQLIIDTTATGTPLAVALVDLDRFKQVNDTLSHDIGDQVLVTVAKLLEAELATIAPEGFVARLGGEEFLLALPGYFLADAGHHLDDVRLAVRSHAWGALTHGQPVTVSIGVTATDGTTGATKSQLLSLADRNLYAAKNAGRDRVVCESSADTPHRHMAGDPVFAEIAGAGPAISRDFREH